MTWAQSYYSCALAIIGCMLSFERVLKTWDPKSVKVIARTLKLGNWLALDAGDSAIIQSHCGFLFSVY